MGKSTNNQSIHSIFINSIRSGPVGLAAQTGVQIAITVNQELLKRYRNTGIKFRVWVSNDTDQAC
jgi:hypothetical protein